MSEGHCREVQGMIKAIFVLVSLLVLRCLHAVRVCVPQLPINIAAGSAAASSCCCLNRTSPHRANNASALPNPAVFY